MHNKFYGFSEKPFEATPDPKFLYFTPSHREALASMIDAIRNRRGFTAITGEAGTGKTTLAYHLLSVLNGLGKKIKTVYISHSTITFKEILKNILLQLNLREVEENTTVLLDRLTKYLTQMAADETVAIIIDEAQNLPEGVIQQFQTFSGLESKAIQVILMGQPGLEDRLNSHGLKDFKQRMEGKCRISALNEKESREYIGHRLRLVGSPDSETFTPEAISMISLYAKGIPRTINILCDNALHVGYGSSEKRIDADIIRQVIKNMEGPIPQETILSSMSRVTKGFRPHPLRLNLCIKAASLAILLLLCIGALILLTQGYLHRRPIKTENMELSKILHHDIGPSPTHLSPGEAKREIPEEKSPHAIDELKQISSESPQTVTPPVASSSLTSGLDNLKEIVIVEEGQNLFYLAQKYYHGTNETFVDMILDFNPEITNANHIVVNQKIKMPKITEELLILESAARTYKIHVGTFPYPDSVRSYSNEAALKGKEIEILPKNVSPGETWYRVIIGNFDDKDRALQMIHLLKKRGLLPLFGNA